MLREFSLNDSESKSADAFIALMLHKAREVGPKCSTNFSYVFTPTGIGTHVKIVENLSGAEQDITDYTSW